MTTARNGSSYRVSPDSSFRGRRPAAALPPAGRERIDAGDPLERLFESGALLHVARAHEAAMRNGREREPGIPTVANLERRMNRARKALRTRPGGATMLSEASRALGATEAFLKRLARELALRGTFEEALSVVARFGILAASLVREERPRGTLEMTQALSAAFWTMQSERDDAVLGATPPGSFARANTKKGGPHGETVEREQRASYDERHRMSVSSTTTARQERLAFADMLLRREKGLRQGIGQNVDAHDALAERVEKLIEVEQANAQRWKQQLTEPTAITVDAPSPTDSRGSVAAITQAPASAVPQREQSPIAPTRPVAASTTSTAPWMPGHAPSPATPNVGQASPRMLTQEERDRNELAGKGYGEAKRIVISTWFAREQDADNKWQANGRRGNRPLTPRFIPLPLSTMFRSDLPREVEWAERHFGWTFEKEQKR